MVLLESKSLLGMALPSFSLPDVHEKYWSSNEIPAENAVLVMFICGHCPYVQAVEERYVALAKHFKGQALSVFGICSNDWNDYPEDEPAQLARRHSEFGYSFPYLLDESQGSCKVI